MGLFNKQMKNHVQWSVPCNLNDHLYLLLLEHVSTPSFFPYFVVSFVVTGLLIQLLIIPNSFEVFALVQAFLFSGPLCFQLICNVLLET